MKELDRALVGMVAASVKDAGVLVMKSSEDMPGEHRATLALILMGWGAVIEGNPESFLEWIRGNQARLISYN